jgi:hypothetical protein
MEEAPRERPDRDMKRDAPFPGETRILSPFKLLNMEVSLRIYKFQWYS